VTPGDVLGAEFMVPLGLSARALGVPSNRITAILAGERGVTAETAILLGSDSVIRLSSGSTCR
jgi:antitoxin HigA-1